MDGGETPEEIASGFDIPVAAVHAALAYAFHNIEELRKIEERNRELSDREAEHRVVPGEST